MARSPAKLLLFGEHAVVFGSQALACTINLHTRVTVASPDRPGVTLSSDALSRSFHWEPDALLPLYSDPASEEILNTLAPGESAPNPGLRAFLFLVASLSPNTNLLVTATSTIPIGAGLGSSAAFSTALAAALLNCTDVKQWADKAEQFVHKTPSGVDTAVMSQGGAILFKQGQITPLIMRHPLRILLIDTGVTRETHRMVSIVRTLKKQSPSIIDPIIESIDQLVGEAALVVGGKSDPQLAPLVDMNHHLLNALGVGHPSLDAVCSAARRYSLSAKLTGAGGGGCAYALLRADSDVDTIVDAVTCAWPGAHAWVCSVGGEGVVLD